MVGLPCPLQMLAVHLGLLYVSDFGPDFSSDRQSIWQLRLFSKGTENNFVLPESEGRCDFQCRGQQGVFEMGVLASG